MIYVILQYSSRNFETFILRLYSHKTKLSKIISALKNYMNSREIKNIDINEITVEHIF
jgi:hypothetical protein